MRLERIEINGFKSFSDRSELAFDKGVTAIVGPNGCGKSNVADAITWVMGEQSAKSLRGERMEDVIFNGSDARKPTATAEVRLRFSGFLKTVSGPAFPEGLVVAGNGNGHSDNGHNGNGHNGTGHQEHGNGNGQALPRAAELKLEAAQQNLTRVDDIVFEVEKQRGTLKRQAAKARRFQKLRDELRRWEKVLFARKYRQLAETIESARGRLADARERETVAAARVGEVDADLGRIRIELVEAETRATQSREAAHARELAITRPQQQIAFDREQITGLDGRSTTVTAELDGLEARPEPARASLAAPREAAAEASADRDRASTALASAADEYDVAHREIEGLEADVEAARSDVFSVVNSATALRHALDHAAAARDRVGETLTKLDVEFNDARIESERVAAERAAASEGLRRAHEAIETTRIARSARDSELASARIEHEWR